MSCCRRACKLAGKCWGDEGVQKQQSCTEHGGTLEGEEGEGNTACAMHSALLCSSH